MKSIIKSVFCVALMLVVLASCSSGKTNTNSADGASSPVAESVTNKVQFKDQQEEFKRFSYTLKENYNSYDEVIAELNNLAKVYKENVDGCSDEYLDEVTEEFNALDEKLLDELKKFPSKYDEEELLSIKFNDKMEFWEDVYIIDGKKGITKELYEKALNIKSKYDKGELSLKEAYDELNKVKFPEPGTSSIS